MADAPSQQPLRFQRSEDFFTGYANSFIFETSVWDLKVIFGQLDQAAGIVEQHTAITMPWTAAKLALYYLKAQVATHEAVYGAIRIPSDILPPGPLPPPDEQKDNPLFQRVYEILKTQHEEFIKENT